MTELAIHSVRFPFSVDLKEVPFFQLAATAIPGIDAIIPGQPETADSDYVPIEITGANITEHTVPLLAYAANFLHGRSDTLQNEGLPQATIDDKLKQELREVIAEKLPNSIPRQG